MTSNTENSKTPYTSIDVEEYYKQSSDKCCCNKSCSCCTCRCCALFILICWIIFGIYGAYDAYNWFHKTSDEWYTSDPCIAEDYNTGPCCWGTTNILGENDIIYIPGTCQRISDAYLIAFVQNILGCLSGIAGTIALIMFISWLVLIPLGYSFISIILNIVLLVVIGFESFLTGYGSAAMGVFIAILFYVNWKIMRDTRNKQNEEKAEMILKEKKEQIHQVLTIN